jgi:hypothetical protein
LQASGQVWCWGANEHGELGNGTTANSSVPVLVAGIDSARAITTGGTWNAGGMGAARSAFACAVLRDGSVQCWGDNFGGQLGTGAVSSSTQPLTISGIDGAVAVAGGNWHACALLKDGSVQCWGNNRWGQLGNGSMTGSSSPVTVLAIGSATSIAGQGSDFSCALLSGGSVQCWGAIGLGPLDNVTLATIGLSTPVIVPSIETTPRGLAAGYQQACAASPDGSQVQCWANLNSPPTGVPGVGSTPVVAVTAGSFQRCALLRDGSIQCWGAACGKQGDGAVPGISDAIAVSGGYGHSCALSKTGTVWCWGDNSAGQLGNGVVDTACIPTPVPVRGL